MDANIALVKLFPGINENTLGCLLTNPTTKAIVLETYGAGNAPTEKWFDDLHITKEQIKKATKGVSKVTINKFVLLLNHEKHIIFYNIILYTIL